MSALRKQMEADMALRGLAYRTRQAYIESVAKFAKFYGRSPDRITEPESQSYLLHLLQERKLKTVDESALLTRAEDWRARIQVQSLSQ